MELLKETILVNDGLVVERVCASQANIFVDDRLYNIHDDELRDLANEVHDRTHGSVTVYLSGVARGCIVLVWNLARKNYDDDLADAVAYLCHCIAGTCITRTSYMNMNTH